MWEVWAAMGVPGRATIEIRWVISSQRRLLAKGDASTKMNIEQELMVRRTLGAYPTTCIKV